jgi:cytochrome b
MRSIVVWDLPTRIFHWTLTVLVILDLTVEAEEGWLLVLHSYAGYLVLLLVLFRLAWGVVGGEHARFGDFVAPWPVVHDYARRAVAGKAPAVIGHNPLGGWMIVLMLATLLVVAVTGIAALGEEGGRGPLSAVVAPGLAEALEEVHEGAADFLSRGRTWSAPWSRAANKCRTPAPSGTHGPWVSGARRCWR